MAILIVALIITSISIYGVIKLKRFYFLLGYFLFSLLAITSLMPTYNEDPMLAMTSLGLFIVLAIISFPARKNISDYNINSEAVPLVKSFMMRTILSLTTVNVIAIFLVKLDTNLPEGMTEDMKIYPMIMHAVLALLPLIVLYKMSRMKMSE